MCNTQERNLWTGCSYVRDKKPVHAHGSQRSFTGTTAGLVGLEKAVLALEINAEY